MTKYKFQIEVTIDEDNIAKKYPNWQFNYNNTEAGLREFAKIVATPHMEENSTRSFGFKISEPKEIN